MKVLELLSSPIWTGPAEPMASVSRELLRRGHDVELAVDGRRAGDLKQRLETMGFAVRGDLALSTRVAPWTYLGDAWRLRRIARDFDLLHANFSNDHALALLALRGRRRQRLVRTIHSERGLGRRRGWSHRRTDGIIAVCQRHAQLLIERCGVEPRRVVAVHGAVDSSFFTPEGANLRAELGIDPHAPVAGIVSRIKPGRGHQPLIDAFAQVLRELPEARLVIVGRGEGLESALAHVHRRGLEREVIFAGYRTGVELAAAYRTFDVKVLMAEGNDGTCRALLEAMSCGVPCISFDFGAPGETIDGETGKLVPCSGDGELRLDLLATPILELLSDRPKARSMGAAARRKMQAQYTEEARGRAVEAFFLRIMSLPPV